MFDWDDLKAFLAVARAGTVQSAARTLKVDQTTIVRRLKALEEKVGVRLFERGQSGSRLTASGLDLLPDAERVEAAAESFLHRAASHQREVAGVLKVTCTEILANFAITPALAAFRSVYPDLRVDLLITDMPLNLEAGEADVALRAAEILDGSDLVGRKIAEFEFALYASRDYLVRRGLPASIADLRDHDLIAGDGVAIPLPGVQWLLDQLPGMEPATRSNSITSMLQALKGGMGVAPFGCLVGDLEPELIRCSPPLQEVTASTWIVTRRELKDVPRVRAFIDFFVPHFAQLQKSLKARGEVAQAEKLAELSAAMAAQRTG